MASKKQSLRQQIKGLLTESRNDLLKWVETPAEPKNDYAAARKAGIVQAYTEVSCSLDMVLVSFKGKALRKEATNLMDSFSNEVAGLLQGIEWTKKNETSFRSQLQIETAEQQVSVYKMAYNQLLQVLRPEAYDIYCFENV